MATNLLIDVATTQEAQRVSGAVVLDVARDQQASREETLSALGTYAICSAIHCETLGKPYDVSVQHYIQIFRHGLEQIGGTPEDIDKLLRALDDPDNYREIFSSLSHVGAGLEQTQKSTKLNREKLVADVLATDRTA
jgi:hypothetical protein